MCITCALGAPGVGESVGQEVVLYAVSGLATGATFFVAQKVADFRRKH